MKRIVNPSGVRYCCGMHSGKGRELVREGVRDLETPICITSLASWDT